MLNKKSPLLALTILQGGLWISKKSKVSILIGELGRPTVVDAEKPVNNQIRILWNFKEEEIEFGFTIDTMSAFDINQQKRYSLVWVKSEKSKNVVNFICDLLHILIYPVKAKTLQSFDLQGFSSF
jgi:hypothetical protein